MEFSYFEQPRRLSLTPSQFFQDYLDDKPQSPKYSLEEQ
jgi:hypothetical protein